MSLSTFLNSLLNEGRVRVDPILDRHGVLVVQSTPERDEAIHVLETFEREYRKELPRQPPSLNRDALFWAAKIIWRASSLLTYRDIDAEQLHGALSEGCPAQTSASVVYSVDLTFRFLPDLIRLARAASPDDPLVPILCAWANEWPLSSVGVQSISVAGPFGWLDDPCLRQLYADRILAAEDDSRLSDPQALEAVRESVGGYPQLAPKLAARLSVK